MRWIAVGVLILVILGSACGDDEADSQASSATSDTAPAVTEEDQLAGFSFTPPFGWRTEAKESEHGRGIVMMSPEAPTEFEGLSNEAWAFVPEETYADASAYVEAGLDLSSVSSTTSDATVAGAASAARVSVEGELEDGTIILTDYLIVVQTDGTILDLSCYGVAGYRNDSACQQLFESVSV
jgi:hypothetical protein